MVFKNTTGITPTVFSRVASDGDGRGALSNMIDSLNFHLKGFVGACGLHDIRGRGGKIMVP